MEEHAVFLLAKPLISDYSLATDIALIGGLDARTVLTVLALGNGQLSLATNKETSLKQMAQMTLLGLELELRQQRQQAAASHPTKRQVDVTSSRDSGRKKWPIKPIVAIAVLTIGLFFWQNSRSHTSLPAQMMAAKSPIQKNVKMKNWLYKDSLIKPLASYEIEALVLSKRNYHDRGAKISPFDLALGWREMSNPEYLKEIKVSQSGRWYHLHWSADVALSRAQILNNSANTHIVPATSTIAKKLKKLKRYDVVHLKGYLIEVDGKDGSRWRSSLSRKDRGNGACELFWVEEVFDE